MTNDLVGRSGHGGKELTAYYLLTGHGTEAGQIIPSKHRDIRQIITC